MPAKEYDTIGDNKKDDLRSIPMHGPGSGGMRGGGEKAKDFNKAILQLVVYCKRSLPVMAIAVVLAVAGSVLNVIGPNYIMEITNQIKTGLKTGIDIDAVVRVGKIVAVLYSLGFIFSLAQGVLMSNLTQKTTKRLRTDLTSKINRLPLKYFDSTTVGDILSRITNDVDTLGQSLTQSLSSFVTSVTMFLGALVMMFYTNWIMATAGVLTTVIGFGMMMAIIRRSQQYFALQQKGLGKINGHIEENYTGHAVVKAYNGVKATKKDLDEMNQQLYRSAWKSQFASGLMMPLMIFMGNLGYVVVCVVGAVLARNGTISFGVIVAFILYIRLFTHPLSQIAQVATSLQSAAAASERVFGFLGEEEMESEEHKVVSLTTVQGDVEFNHVQFGYNEDKPIIHDFSTSVKAGQKIAIVGPTGAGKTTIVNLLMRFYELWSGSISIDGVPLNNLRRENVHQLFGMVLQDTWLFEGTIRGNIVYNKQGVTDEKLDEICKTTGLYHFITTLPKGLDTVLDDNASLSAGQKQLVTIARAMVENAPLLILDEATSSVDTRTEMLIQNAMDRLMAGRTSFVIAHRLSTIRNADLILVMKDGDIIESGTHDELRNKNGFYADLYNSQFEKVS